MNVLTDTGTSSLIMTTDVNVRTSVSLFNFIGTFANSAVLPTQRGGGHFEGSDPTEYRIFFTTRTSARKFSCLFLLLR